MLLLYVISWRPIAVLDGWNRSALNMELSFQSSQLLLSIALPAHAGLCLFRNMLLLVFIVLSLGQVAEFWDTDHYVGLVHLSLLR